ncbi:hypothetical protein F909_01681 [Acinetobacter sp. ANC 3929]|uniref:hypothetical protein n=1 Tax=unclassified Acinetobacter TaxID=196816 RepID=UPI0002D11A12|nr:MULTISPECIES: hypothetical protein [unclassified Acinetobacter]ENW81992.1 hypothetical protein F909_01681 [Acinetobacter sp. ANC 3929]ENX42627.1 hypothetical protein F887_00790 [Acinetobacter sp. NIPH 2100]MCH7315239.1 hypothetical protein [Acinetobacter sp. ANC 3882]MCH7352672.1 hypothetical protein [Acinetobacter sp. NIPH 2023]MCH7356718.1 hypothetical protein [Acinetobacter sp. NIPH 1958]
MKRPNRVFAPIIIAGITVGFLASAYKFVITKSNSSKEKPLESSQQISTSEAANSSDEHN